MEYIQHIRRNWKVVLIVTLAILFCLKSCQSCSRKQTIAFYEYDSGRIIDSLCDINKTLSDSIMTLNNDITILNNELVNKDNELHILQDNNDHLKKTNNKLIEKSK